jgi:NAD(P)-dependent dehydrogenase (short-subunit alcohol dehydrogenase family)
MADTPRTVLVTGSARRLGRAIALALAAGGWQVVVHHRDSQQEADDTVAACGKAGAPGLGHTALQADLVDEAAVRALVPRAVAACGALHAIVNNASLFAHDDAASFTTANLDAHMRTNTAAPILLAHALHAHLAEHDGTGAVVNLLDQKLFNPNPDFLSYTLSKAALHSATTLLAQALAPRVRVVGVAPGLTLTSHMLAQDKFEALHKLSPLGRSSTPEDVASAVRFALDNQSLTGTTLLVDGGQHLMRFERDFSLM